MQVAVVALGLLVAVMAAGVVWAMCLDYVARNPRPRGYRRRR